MSARHLALSALRAPQPVLDFNFLVGLLDPSITFARATTGPATYFDATGTLQTARNNLFLWSTDFNNAAWTLFNGATKGATVTGPDGQSTGITVNFAVTANSQILQTVTITGKLLCSAS